METIEGQPELPSGAHTPPDGDRSGYEEEGNALDEAALIGRLLARHGVRDLLEGLHAGTVPQGRKADRSDITVSTPSGEIAWPQVSHITDKEMRALMLQVEKRLAGVYWSLRNLEREGKLDELLQQLRAEYKQYGVSWDLPKAMWQDRKSRQHALRQQQRGKHSA